jgi:hypothetical protein
MRCGHASRSRMLQGNACIVGVDVVVWRLMARRCGDELPNDLSRSCNRGVIRCSGQCLCCRDQTGAAAWTSMVAEIIWSSCSSVAATRRWARISWSGSMWATAVAPAGWGRTGLSGSVGAVALGEGGSSSADPVLELPVSRHSVMSELLPTAKVGRPVLVEASAGVSMVRARSMAVSIVFGW